MKANAVEVGARIKSIRLSKGLNLNEFGKKFNPRADRSLASAWENGRYIPNPERLKIIADLAGITVDELLFGKQNELEKFTTEQLLEEIKRRL